MSAPDLLDTLSGSAPGSRVAALRVERADIARHMQGAHDALLVPPDPCGLTLSERAAVAAAVARDNADAALSAHSDVLVSERGVPAGSRWSAIAANKIMYVWANRLMQTLGEPIRPPSI